MSHRTFFAALLAGTALAGPALAADLAVKAPVAQIAGIPTDWSGVYLGLEGGYGWGKQKFDNFSIGGFGGTGNIDNILGALDGNGTVLVPGFNLGGPASIKANGGLLGGFAGVQKQMGSWVLGLEADFDASWMKGSFNTSSVQTETVSGFMFGSPAVTGFAAVAPVQITIPGQTIVSTGTVPEQTITIPVKDVVGTINPNTTSICPCTLTIDLGALGKFSVPIPAIDVPVNGKVNVPGQNLIVTIPAQDISVTGKTLDVKVTVPGQNAPLTAHVAASVLQRTQLTTDVTRTLSVDTKIDELGSARGKIGFALAPNFLLYGTGGLAFAHVENTINATESFTFGETPISRTRSLTGGATLLGFAFGAGLDWKTPIPNVILGVEYLHYEFPKHTISLVDSLGSGATALSTSRESVDAVKGRLSVLFPIH